MHSISMGFLQNRCLPIAYALDLYLICINPLICNTEIKQQAYAEYKL